MNPAESLLLCRYVKAACPQQAVDKYTPDTWHDLLGDLDFEQASSAVKELCKRQPFVSPSEVRDEVKAIRARRIDRFKYVHPSDLPDADGDFGTPEWESSIRLHNRAAGAHQRLVYRLVGDGLLAAGDPTPSYEDLRPIIEAEWVQSAAAELEATETRRAALTARLSAPRSIAR